MNDLDIEIARWVHDRGVGVYETSNPSARTIFTGEEPYEVVKGLLIVQSPSPPPHQYVDTEYTVLDFWAVNPSTPEAKQKMRDIHNLFHRRANWSTPNWYIYFSQSLGSPIDVDRDLEGGKLLRLSVQFICRNLNNVS